MATPLVHPCVGRGAEQLEIAREMATQHRAHLDGMLLEAFDAEQRAAVLDVAETALAQLAAEDRVLAARRALNEASNEASMARANHKAAVLVARAVGVKVPR